MTSTKTVFDIIPDLNFDVPTLSGYYPTTATGDNYGNGEED